MVDSTPNEDWLDKLDGPKYYHDFEDVRLGQNPFSNREDADQYFGIDHEKLGSQKHDSQSDSAIDDYETAGSSDNEEVEEVEEVSEAVNEVSEEVNEEGREEEDEEENEEDNEEVNEEVSQSEDVKQAAKDISNEDTSENKNSSRRPPRNLCTNFEEWDKMKAKCKVAKNSSAHPHPTRKKIVDKTIQKVKDESSPHKRTRNASSISSASSSSSGIKLPTIPTTPEFMRRNKLHAKSKSTEEQQLLEINRKKEEMRKTSIKNKTNLIKSKSASFRSHKPTPKSPTKPEEFHFASDSRLRSNKQDQIDKEFADGLRSQHISKPHKIGPTIPQPFHFHETHAKKNFETYKTDAEKVNAYSSKTPDRFRTSKRNAGPDLPKKTRLTVTVPKTPNFAKHPRRHTSILSAKEKEDLEIEDMNKHQFKAHSFNKKVLEAPKLKKPDVKPSTVIEPFDFESSHRPRKEHETNEEEEIVHFHAKPAPKNILKHAIGIPVAESAPITVPESPAFQNRQRSKPQKPATVEKPKINNEHKPKIHHGVPFIPKSANNHKVFAEASTPVVYKRSKAMLEHREKFVEEELKKEKEKRYFEATLLPYSVENPHHLPTPKEIPITKPKPFGFLVDERGEKYKEKLAHQISEEEEKHKKEAEFKAKEPIILKSKPFAPKIDKRPITLPEGFQFATEKRAMEREDYESWKRQAEEEKAALQAARKKEKEEMERNLAEEARKKTILKANPIRTYKPVHPFSPKPLTEPKTPKFSNRTRCHEDEILKDIQNNF